ncbi:MAG: 6-carboxytetrahydropterin synthase [Bacteroidota bacterium]|nr:6-carboxytetrahydropterin synthase [Bacteroidota bacterium]
MTKIRITKEYHFEMAHALPGYDGLCKNIHGHSYKLFVTIIGSPISDKNSPKCGMVMDFNDLKAIVRKEIIERLDHSLALYENDNNRNDIIRATENVVILPYLPTCENMLEDFAVRIKDKLPANVKLYSIMLRETATSFAEWYAEDNRC